MNRLAVFTALVVASTFLVPACQPPRDSSTPESLAADTGAKNYAVVFTGSTEGVPGVRKDPGNVRRIFGDASLGLGFTIQGDVSETPTASAPGDTVVKEATSGQILAKSAEVARRMLDEEKATGKKGTMFWYLSSHGGKGGELVTADGCIYFSQVAKAIRDARGGVPLKRLVVFIDVCFAGQTINGTQSINKQSADRAMLCDLKAAGGLPSGILGLTDGVEGTGGGAVAEDVAMRTEVQTRLAQSAQTQGLNYTDSVAMLTSGMAAFDAMSANGSVKRGFGLTGTYAQGDLYEQGFFGASSSLTQESGDSPNGGAGTVAYGEAFRTLYQSKRTTATFRDIANGTLLAIANGTAPPENTNSPSQPRQTPVFNYDPPALQNEYVFVPGASNDRIDPMPAPVLPSPLPGTPPYPNNGLPNNGSGNANGDLVTELIMIINAIAGGGP